MANATFEAQPAKLTIFGQVTSGRGWARADMSDAFNEMRMLMGERFYAGTFNIILNRPIRLQEAWSVKTADGKMFWPATFRDVRLWLYRWVDAPLHSAELVSSLNLRDRFGLKDGDDVTLELDGRFIEAITPSERVAWEFFWRGRRRWYYSNDLYYSRTRYPARRLGATQLKQNDTPYEVVSAFLKKRLL